MEVNEKDSFMASKQQVTSVVWHPKDDNQLLFSTKDGHLKLYDLKQKKTTFDM